MSMRTTKMLKCLARRNVRDVPLLLMNIHLKHGLVNCWSFLNFLWMWRERARVPCLSGKLLSIRLMWHIVWWSIQEPGSGKFSSHYGKIAWQSRRGNSRFIHHTHEWRVKAPGKPFRNDTRIWPVDDSFNALRAVDGWLSMAFDIINCEAGQVRSWRWCHTFSKQ
jgi:hypothetical protein